MLPETFIINLLLCIGGRDKKIDMAAASLGIEDGVAGDKTGQYWTTSP